MYIGNTTTSVKKWLGWWVSVARANNILLLKGTVPLQEKVRDAFLVPCLGQKAPKNEILG